MEKCSELEKKYSIKLKKKKKYIQTLYLCGLECVFCFFMKNPIFRVSSSLDNIHSYERIFFRFFYTVYVLFLLSLFTFNLVDFLYTIFKKKSFLFLRIRAIIILGKLFLGTNRKRKALILKRMVAQNGKNVK